jgi:hypothetical protein
MRIQFLTKNRKKLFLDNGALKENRWGYQEKKMGDFLKINLALVPSAIKAKSHFIENSA